MTKDRVARARSIGHRAWAALCSVRAGIAADLRRPEGYARHLGTAACTAGAGAIALRTLAATSTVVPAAALGGAAMAAQVAVPGLLVLTAVLSALDTAALPVMTRRRRLDLVGGATAGRLATALGVAVGLSAAPWLGGAALAPVGTRLAVALGLGTALVAQAAWLQRTWRPAADVATVGAIALGAALAPVGWSLLAGSGLALAVGTGLAVGTCLLGGLLLHAYMLASAGQQNFTPYADGHVVARPVVRAHRAGGGAAPATVYAMPPALVAKVQQVRAAVRHDDEGRPYVLGLPVVLLEGPPGCGKTAMAHAVAEALDAELLRASAASLGRVHLPNYDAAVMRAATLIGQAELRALRTGRLHVVLLDEVGALLGRTLALHNGDGLAHAHALGRLALMLTVQNARRNGVVLVLIDEDLMACRDALLAISPQAPITVGLPDAATLGTVFEDALGRMLGTFAATWQVPVADALATDPALAALRPQVAALAAQGAAGRHAVGIVARMRRDAEASLVGVPAQQRDAAAVRVVLAEAGARAVHAYAETLGSRPRAAPHLPPDAVHPPAGALDVGLRRMLEQVSRNPAGALLDAVGAQVSRTLDGDQSVHYTTISRSANNTIVQIYDRCWLDIGTFRAYGACEARAQARRHPSHDPLLAAAWTEFARSFRPFGHDPGRPGGGRATDHLLELRPRSALTPEARALVAGGAGLPQRLGELEAQQHEPSEHFADVTLPMLPDSFLPLVINYVPSMPRTTDANPYRGMAPVQRYYLMLRQRQDGLRRDTYRSENLMDPALATALLR